jgi:hypothetical protein
VKRHANLEQVNGETLVCLIGFLLGSTVGVLTWLVCDLSRSQ